MTALLKCEVTRGPRNGYKTIGVASIEGYSEYMSIEDRFLVPQGETFLLPVQLIGQNKVRHIYLVQLPVEADSGANRVWVSDEIVVDTPDQVHA
jgi:hypothetical protein